MMRAMEVQLKLGDALDDARALNRDSEHRHIGHQQPTDENHNTHSELWIEKAIVARDEKVLNIDSLIHFQY